MTTAHIQLGRFRAVRASGALKFPSPISTAVCARGPMPLVAFLKGP